jgi:hypothetical protein
MVTHTEEKTYRAKVFEKRALRKIVEPKRDEVKGEWRKLHDEEAYDMYSLSNIMRVIKSRRMSRLGLAANMGEGGDSYGV